jgi:purine-nucleoside phosphorylase
MLHLAAQIAEATTFIRTQWQGTAQVGVILGTGLGGLAREIESPVTIPYESIPHFPRSTAISHAGQLVCGKLGGATVVAMEGRFHAYEGYSQHQLTFPVRVMKALGANTLIVSNACGGMNPFYRRGDIMVIDDHINLLGDNPLIGVNDEALGPRFPDMSCPYDPALIECALEIARRENFIAHRGVYVAVTGPNLETRAEYRFLRTIGADVVGMSTVPEVIVAVHASMRVLGLSVITDMCFPDALEPANIDMILAAAADSEPKLRAIVLGALQRIADGR